MNVNNRGLNFLVLLLIFRVTFTVNVTFDNLELFSVYDGTF